ncbi:MAG: hypothetical protein II170_00920, partial [Bacteroidaceae bacterium]|nr:hypothetical protein [Bacteroidaceae bacterium]
RTFAFMKRAVLIVLLLVPAFWLQAAETEMRDTVLLAPSSQQLSVGWRPVDWLLQYLRNANRPSEKPFDCKFLCGPYYTSTYSFGLAGGLSGEYSWDRSDPTLARSMATLFLNASVLGVLKLTLEGKNYMPHDAYRWDYKLAVENLPTDFWGIGYDAGLHGAKGHYRQLRLLFQPNWLFRVREYTYVGPTLWLQYSRAVHFTNPETVSGQRHNIASAGAGVVVQYDSRDFALNAYRGNFLKLEHLVFPGFANHYAFQRTELIIDSYRQMWRGSVLAMDLHAQFNYGDVPWTMLAKVGENGRMRGYYEGRYRNRNILEGQVELRQHLFGRFGCVLWGGAANVFRNFGHIYLSQTLPTFGTGLRWEFKKRVNLRFDVGLTRNKPGFEFKMNEAF